MQKINLFGKVDGDRTVWVNSDTDPVLIIDGKIEFFDPAIGCFFSLYVKQVKGRGTADADKLTVLNDYHKTIIQIMQDNPSWEWMTGEQIRKFCKARITSQGQIFKENNWMRPISELYRRKIISKNDTNPPKYSLRQQNAKKAMESGKFE